MEAYKERLLTLQAQIIEKYNSFSTREQWMVLIAIVAILFLMWQMVLSGSLKEVKKNKSKLAVISAQFIENEQKINDYAQSMADIERGDDDKKVESEMATLRYAEESLNDIISKMADPQSLMVVSSTLLFENNKIEVEHILTKPIMSEIEVIKGEIEGEDENAPKVYKHSIYLELKGDYFDVMAYFAKIDQMPFTVFYDNLSIETLAYPSNRVGISLYTVTLDKDWGRELNK